MSAEKIESLPKSEREQFLYDIIWWRVRNPLVLEAFAKVDRRAFAPPEFAEKAYKNEIIELGNGSSISQPSLVADMIDHLGLMGKEKALELGTGSGYCAALLSYCTAEVHTIESNPSLAEAAQQRLKNLGIENVTVHIGDGLLGLPDFAPFDSIIITAGIRIPPQNLCNQLREGGRIIMPVGPDPKNLDMVVALNRPNELFGKIVDAVRFHSVVTDRPEGWSEEDLKKVLEIKRYFIKDWGRYKGISEQEALVAYARMKGWKVEPQDLEDPEVEEKLLCQLRIPTEVYPIFGQILEQEKQSLSSEEPTTK